MKTKNAVQKTDRKSKRARERTARQHAEIAEMCEAVLKGSNLRWTAAGLTKEARRRFPKRGLLVTPRRIAPALHWCGGLNVIYDRGWYSWSGPSPAAEAPPFSADGPLTDVAPVSPTMPSPRPETILPPAALPDWLKDGAPVVGIDRPDTGTLRLIRHGYWGVRSWSGSTAAVLKTWLPAPATTAPPSAARDLADRQAFGPMRCFSSSTARERILSILERARLPRPTAGSPGVIATTTFDGRVVLSWGVLHDGQAISCAWTEAAEESLEHAARELQDAGYKASVGGHSASAITGAPVDGERRAPVPTEAAQEIKHLNDRIEHLIKSVQDATRAQIDAEKERDSLRGHFKDVERKLAATRHALGRMEAKALGFWSALVSLTGAIGAEGVAS